VRPLSFAVSIHEYLAAMRRPPGIGAVKQGGIKLADARERLFADYVFS
jgi:hypothetical protein